MDNDNPEEKRYLTELCSMTQGNVGAQVSMFDVGAAIGLERADAGMMAEELIVQGFAELKTLSGGIGITSQGVEMIRGKMVASPVPAGDALQLGSGTVLGEKGRQAVEKVLGNIRTAVIQQNATFGQLEEIVIDIKTIETQMLSPNPKIAVIREVLRSLHKSLTGLGAGAVAEEVNVLVFHEKKQ
jgi:hypothetical protein